jgi:hypothetical protein
MIFLWIRSSCIDYLRSQSVRHQRSRCCPTGIYYQTDIPKPIRLPEKYLSRTAAEYTSEAG